MPGMPGRYAKGPILERVDQRSADAAAMQAALAQLENLPQKGIVDIALDHGFITRPMVPHLRKHWFNDDPTDPKRWWPAHQPIEPVIRLGMERALKAAVALGVPLNVIWLCAADLLEVLVAPTPGAVTALLVTPPPPPEAGPWPRMEPLWLSRRGPVQEWEKDEGSLDDVHLVQMRTKPLQP